MIAYHFPPLAGSSGIQRTLRFVQHLPALGWQPVVLTADPRAYEQTSEDLMRDVPASTPVCRAFALDTARHLNIKGRYPGWMARPDRWISWRFDAVRQGMRLIREHRPDVIWSTYPIATAHVIAQTLHRNTGIPWVADFRDPMAQEGYPSDPQTWRSYQRIEETALLQARHSVFTTPGAAAIYRERYPDAAERVEVLENGYDEESFSGSGLSLLPEKNPNGQRPLILLHSGIVYPSERDPTQLFMALQRLSASGRLKPTDVRIRFRASVHDSLLSSLATRFGVAEFIEMCPPVPYREALAEMLSVDALLVMQASNCNAQIPAKIYEYLRAGKPIIGLTDPAGDTAGVLRGAGLDAIARLDVTEEIEALLPAFLDGIRERRAVLPARDAVLRASRRGRSEALAQLLGRIVPS
ncbi:glycosyltransferase [Rhodoferax koreense]|uniref:Glycosyltransferase n=2 Tax=Rhodoferax koreensis TaxID=1842727 RepID=A0A1P8K0F9_9BURK|nr:glycosyltransferase [Rhodoferax koreense]